MSSSPSTIQSTWVSNELPEGRLHSKYKIYFLELASYSRRIDYLIHFVYISVLYNPLYRFSATINLTLTKAAMPIHFPIVYQRGKRLMPGITLLDSFPSVGVL